MPDPADFFQPADAPRGRPDGATPDAHSAGDVVFSHDGTGSGVEPSGGGRGLELVKHGRRYFFDCPPGKEADTLAQLALLIDDDTNDLTWFDAALLCHQLGQRMGRKLSHLRKPA